MRPTRWIYDHENLHECISYKVNSNGIQNFWKKFLRGSPIQNPHFSRNRNLAHWVSAMYLTKLHFRIYWKNSFSSSPESEPKLKKLLLNAFQPNSWHEAHKNLKPSLQEFFKIFGKNYFQRGPLYKTLFLGYHKTQFLSKWDPYFFNKLCTMSKRYFKTKLHFGFFHCLVFPKQSGGNSLICLDKNLKMMSEKVVLCLHYKFFYYINI